MTAITVNFNSLKLTDEQFFQLCQVNELLLLERNEDGTLVLMPLAGGLKSICNCDLTAQLGNWNRDENLGVAFGSCTGFTLPNSAVRSPNAAWIKRDRWDVLTEEQRAKFAPVCPDFVVELGTKDNCWQRLQAKMQEYRDNGARLGWLIDLISRRVEIYRQEREVEVLEFPSNLSGEDVLPGFVLNLESIWETF